MAWGRAFAAAGVSAGALRRALDQLSGTYPPDAGDLINAASASSMQDPTVKSFYAAIDAVDFGRLSTLSPVEWHAVQNWQPDATPAENIKLLRTRGRPEYRQPTDVQRWRAAIERARRLENLSPPPRQLQDWLPADVARQRAAALLAALKR